MENMERTGKILGVWRLGRLLGSGGMGDVYLAKRNDGVVEQTAAVKVLRAPFRADVPDEAWTLERLNHPNIARYFDSGVTPDGHRYVVMEYVAGRPITDYADQKGLSIHRRLDLFLEVCAAIEHSHHQLVVHLDLKPGNILVDKDRTVKVIDFGIARRIEGREEAAAPGAFSGPYASPEQIQEGGRVGFAADIYALGAVLYELLCGHAPFDPLLATAELERQIAEDTPPPPSVALNRSKLRVSDDGRHYRLEADAIAKMRGGCRLTEARKLIAGDLDRICLFALRKEPARRYKWVANLRSDLEAVLEGRVPAIAKSGDPMYTVLRAARRKPLNVLGTVAAITAVTTAVMFFLTFSAGIEASLQSTRQFERVAAPSLDELRGQLRPRLAGAASSSASLEVLDAVVRTASPVRRPQTFWDKMQDDFVLQIRRATGTMPKDDLRQVP
jgi:serine/threonine protein kinase